LRDYFGFCFGLDCEGFDMSQHRFINVLLALLIAIGLSTSFLLDGPDDIATAQKVADDLASLTGGAK
jgi:hypothetical protein